MKGLAVLLIVALSPIHPSVAGEQYTCNMMALTEEEQQTYQRVAESLLASVQEQKELRDGYAFRLPHERIVEVAQWISFERRCCPFFEFELEIAKNDGPVWLRITGDKGIKDFIRAEFGLAN